MLHQNDTEHSTNYTISSVCVFQVKGHCIRLTLLTLSEFCSPCEKHTRSGSVRCSARDPGTLGNMRELSHHLGTLSVRPLVTVRQRPKQKQWVLAHDGARSRKVGVQDPRGENHFPAAAMTEMLLRISANVQPDLHAADK